MSLTVPQMILMGHAAHVNAERSGLLDRDKSEVTAKVRVRGKEKDLSEMDSNDYAEYYGDWNV